VLSADGERVERRRTVKKKQAFGEQIKVRELVIKELNEMDVVYWVIEFDAKLVSEKKVNAFAKMLEADGYFLPDDVNFFRGRWQVILDAEISFHEAKELAAKVAPPTHWRIAY
jgi:hypothetical protein